MYVIFFNYNMELFDFHQKFFPKLFKHECGKASSRFPFFKPTTGSKFLQKSNSNKKTIRTIQQIQLSYSL